MQRSIDVAISSWTFVETSSIDEQFMDVTGSIHLHADAPLRVGPFDPDGSGL